MKGGDERGTDNDRTDAVLHDVLHLHGREDNLQGFVDQYQGHRTFGGWFAAKVDAVGGLTRKFLMLLGLVFLYNYVGPWSVIALGIGTVTSWMIWNFADHGNYIYIIYLHIEKTAQRMGIIEVGHNDWVENWTKDNALTPIVSDAGNMLYLAQEVDRRRKYFKGTHVHGMTPLDMATNLQHYQEAADLLEKLLGVYQESKVLLRIKGHEIARDIVNKFFKMLDAHLLAKRYTAHETDELKVRETWLDDESGEAPAGLS